EAFKTHMPKLHVALEAIKASNFDEQVIYENFKKLKRISIDYGIMEKVKEIIMVQGRFHWDDVGDWAALDRILPPNQSGNIIRGTGKLIDINTKNCVFDISERTVATIGVSNLIIVVTKDIIMICPKDRAQDVKKLTALVQKQEPILFE
ncbi:MAG: mannose-1-phosphate guanylyltransferase, partial [Promethearchaeota archaeon]